MSLTADKLTNKSAVFNEWIGKYPELKNYTQQGLPRTLSADDLLGFTAPNAAWREATKPPRARSRQIGTDQGMRTLSPELHQIKIISRSALTSQAASPSPRTSPA
jgi:hypothetical protein